MPDWADTWVAALTNPTVAMYKHIRNDPEATNKRAYTWMLASVTLMRSICSARARPK